ncbi:MAG: TRAP transporter large permease, partial [Rubrivivax sp.]
VLMGLSLAVAWFLIARKSNLPRSARAEWPERLESIRRGAWALLLPVIIIGGLKFGIFTPTEAAVVASVYALLVSVLVYRSLTLARVQQCLIDASRMSAVVMFLVAAASVSAWLITIADLPSTLTAWAQPFVDRPVLLMAMLMVLVFAVGTALDFVPTVLILTPIVMPLVKQAGIDPVYFGVLFIMNNAIGLITPPVGSVLNVAAGVGKVPMEAAIRGVLPFMLAQLVVLAMLVAFPSIVLAPLHWLTR